MNNNLLIAFINRQIIFDSLNNSFWLVHKELFTKALRDIDKNLLRELKPLEIDNSKLLKFAKQEHQWLMQTFAKMIQMDGLKPLSDKVIEEMVSNLTLEGHQLNEHFKKIADDSTFKIASAYESLSGIDAKATLAGIIAGAENKAQATILTANSLLQNQIRQKLYDENIDLIDGFEFVATLDLKTTKNICAPRDGLRWDNKYQPIGHNIPYRVPPLHYRCRSLIIPFFSDLPQSKTRASKDGYVDRNTKYFEWLKTQSPDEVASVFGKKNADLLFKGKITPLSLLKPIS